MTSSVEESAKHTQSAEQMAMEDDEDLFEIDLNAVDCIVPQPDYCENYHTSTGIALLANCLLPIADISSAVPASNAMSLAGTSNIFLIAEPAMSLGEYLRLPFLRALGILHKSNYNNQI